MLHKITLIALKIFSNYFTRAAELNMRRVRKAVSRKIPNNKWPTSKIALFIEEHRVSPFP